MRKVFKSFLLIAFMALLINVSKVKAAGELVIPVDGASIRLKTEEKEQGLRFYAKLDDSVKDNEHGFYVVYGKTTVEDLRTAIDEADGEIIFLNGKEVFVVDVPAVREENEYSVVLLEIPEEGYFDKVSVVPYVIVEEEIVLPETPVTRSVGEVAIKLIEAEETIPEGMEEALANFFRIGYIGDNLEIVKGLIVEDEYVDLDLYEVYHESVGEVLLPVPEERLDYTFEGWYLDDEFTGEPVTTIDLSLITEDLMLYANWQEEVIEYIENAVVEFDFSDLEGAEATDLSPKDKEEDLNAIFEDAEYFVSASSTGKFYASIGRIKFSTKSENGNLKLVFEDNVSFSTIVIYAYAWSGDDTASIKINDEDPVSLGQEVLRYVVELSKSSNVITFLATKRVLITKIELYGEETDVVLPKYAVTLDPDNGESSTTQYIEDGDFAIIPSVEPEKEGFNFLGWYIGDVEFDFVNTPIVREITIKAKWEMIVEEYIEDASVEFSFDNLTAIGTGISGDYLKDKYIDELLEDIEIIGSVYDGNKSGSTNYANTPGLIKFGTESANGELKFVFKGDVKIGTVIIYAAGWTATEGELLVNEINPVGTGNISDTKTRYVIELDEATKEITIGTSSKRAFLFAAGFYGPEAEVPEPIMWEVSFDLNYDGAPTLDSVMVENGEKVIKPANPTRDDGFTFEGWYLGDNEFTFDTPVEEDIELVAKWEELSTDLSGTYESNFSIVKNGVELNNSVYSSIANQIFTLSAIKNDGHAAPTYYDSGTAARFYGNSSTKGSSLEITIKDADYYIESITFIFPSSGQTGGNVTITEGINNIMLNNLSATSEDFKALLTDDKVTYNFANGATKITIQNTTSGATTQFKLVGINVVIGKASPKDKYELSFDTDGGTSVNPQMVEEGSLITEPTGVTKGDLFLEGWYKESSFTTKWDFATDRMPSSDLTLYAKWVDEPQLTEQLLYSYNFSDGGSSDNSAYAKTNLQTNVSYADDNPGGTSGTTAWTANYANLSLSDGTRLGGKVVSTEHGSPSASIQTDFKYDEPLTKIEILEVATFGTAGNVTKIFIQTSTDGTNWTTVASTTDKSGTLIFDNLNIAANTYIKIVVELKASSKNSGIQFTGIKVSGLK